MFSKILALRDVLPPPKKKRRNFRRCCGLCPALAVPRAYWSDAGTEKVCRISQITLYSRHACSEWENTFHDLEGKPGSGWRCLPPVAYMPTRQRKTPPLWTCATWNPSPYFLLWASPTLPGSPNSRSIPRTDFPVGPQSENKTSVWL